MGPGFKYHIVTISAIFFALTIGLVIGSVFVSPQFANRQQSLLIKLQSTLNTDVEEKRKEIARYAECVGAIAPLALRGRLGPSTVAIIHTGDYPEYAARASEAIGMAQPRSIVRLNLTSALDRADDELRTALSESHGRNAVVPADRDALYQAIATALAHGDTQDPAALPQFEREGFLRLTGEDNYSQPVKYAVVVGGSRNADSQRAARVDVPLIRALLKQGIGVVACEGAEAIASDMPSYRALRTEISTVDNVDTDIGRCALVLAFTGLPGAYGVKAGADHLLPISPPH